MCHKKYITNLLANLSLKFMEYINIRSQFCYNTVEMSSETDFVANYFDKIFGYESWYYKYYSHVDLEG